VKSYRRSLEYKMERILLFIASTAPSTKKTIERKMKPAVDKPTIYKAIKRLVEGKRLAVVRKEKSGMVKYYDLTRLGVMDVVLCAFEDAGEDAGKISDFVKKLFTRYPEWLPDVASLWPAIENASTDEPRYLKEQPNTSLEALVLSSLVFDICEDQIADAVRFEQYGVAPRPEVDEPVSTILLSRIDLEGDMNLDEEYALRWMMALQNNSTLREAATQAIRRRLGRSVANANKYLKQLNAAPIELKPTE